MLPSIPGHLTTTYTRNFSLVTQGSEVPRSSEHVRIEEAAVAELLTSTTNADLSTHRGFTAFRTGSDGRPKQAKPPLPTSKAFLASALDATMVVCLSSWHNSRRHSTSYCSPDSLAVKHGNQYWRYR
jgi:hypothetical protein